MNIDKLTKAARVFPDYCRAYLLGVRGAQLGKKVRIGERCRFSEIKNIEIGTRTVLEGEIVIKLVSSTAKLALQNHVFVGRRCIFDIFGKLTIGQGTLIAPGCFITDHNHSTHPDSMIWTQECTHSPVAIGNDVWLGAYSIILPGVTIGDGSVIAAGAVVTKSVEPMTIVAGIPARFLRERK